jgi:hypothetical protein
MGGVVQQATATVMPQIEEMEMVGQTRRKLLRHRESVPDEKVSRDDRPWRR